MEPCASAPLVHRPLPPGSSQTSDNRSTIPPHGERSYNRPSTLYLNRRPSSNSILGDSDTPQGDSFAVAGGKTHVTPRSPGSNEAGISSTKDGFANAENIDKLNDRPISRFLFGKTFRAKGSKSNSKDNTLSDTYAGREVTGGARRPSSSSSSRSLRLRIVAGFKDIAARSRSSRQFQPISPPSQWKHTPASETSSSSNLLLSSSYLTDTNLTSLTSQRSPNPIFDSNDAQLLIKGPSPALAYIEKRNWRKHHLHDPVLTFVDRFKGKHSRHRRRQEPPTTQLAGGSRDGRNDFKSSTSAGTKSGTTSGTRSSAAKRPNSDGDAENPENNENGDDNDGPSPKRPKPDKEPGRFFACPYFKLDPTKHWACEKFHFTTWAHVKQHLRRKHDLKEFQCPRCDSRYKTRDACDEHIRSCEVSRRISPHGQTNLDSISEEAQRDISQIRSRERGVTDADRWNKAWKILFDPIPQPDTPFKKDTPTELLAYFGKQLFSRPPTVDDSLIAENIVSSTADVDRILSRVLEQVTSVPNSALRTDTPQRTPIPRTRDIQITDAASATNQHQMQPIAEAMPERDHDTVHATLVSAAAGGDSVPSLSPLLGAESPMTGQGEFLDLLYYENYEENMDSTDNDVLDEIS